MVCTEAYKNAKDWDQVIRSVLKLTKNAKDWDQVLRSVLKLTKMLRTGIKL